MTQEDKELLLKDLSARLPYGVIVRHQDALYDIDGNSLGTYTFYNGYLCDICTEDDQTTTMIISEGEEEGYEHINMLEDTRSYLRPMSSMTEEELEEYADKLMPLAKGNFDYIGHFDWLNAHHFDYRGLLSRGLALEAPEGMYNV